MVAQNLVSLTGGQMGKAGFQSCSDVTPGHVSSSGVPSALWVGLM